MKKQWISVKCGLSRDPKHRQAMGESVWLFLHMLDRADWESGKVTEWKDEGEADEMGMPVRTLREHRRKLEELDYISCAQKQYGQEIAIHNWTNPREYSGTVINKKQGDKETSLQETGQGYTQGYTQGNRKDVTPTSDSNIKESIPEIEKPAFNQELADIGWTLKAGKKVTQKQLYKRAEASAFDEGIEVELKRLRLNWIAFDEKAKETFRRFIRELPAGQTLNQFVSWWLQDEWRAANPPWTLAVIMQRWLQAFGVQANNEARSPQIGV